MNDEEALIEFTVAAAITVALHSTLSNQTGGTRGREEFSFLKNKTPPI